MSRKTQIDLALLSDFARWAQPRMQQRGTTLTAIAEHTGISISYLHKIMKSHLPRYKQYKSPSFEKTVQIGQFLGDVGGALRAAGYTDFYEAATATDPASRMDSASGMDPASRRTPPPGRPRPAGAASHTAPALPRSDPRSDIVAMPGTVGVPARDGWVRDAWMPEKTEDWPPELLEAMHYSQTLDPETQQYIYCLWREQARVMHAALNAKSLKQHGRENLGLENQGLIPHDRNQNGNDA